MEVKHAKPVTHWLEGAFVLSIIPLYNDILWWLFSLAVVLYFWRIHAIKKGKNSPKRLLKLFIVLSSIALFTISIQSFFSLQTFVSLLVLAACLKLMELESSRDYYIFVFLGCFISASQLLFHNGLFSFFYSVLCFLFLHICLLKINTNTLLVERAASTKQKGVLNDYQQNRVEMKSIKKVSVLFLQAIPIAIVLFIVMPRVGSLWKMPLSNDIAKTGVSDNLSIGDIGRLNQDHSVAMRVTFQDGKKPNPSQLYWRGMLLSYFDGKTWHKQQSRFRQPSLSLAQKESLINYSDRFAADSINYEVMLERTGRHWLYTLNTAIIDDAKFRNDVKQWFDYSHTKISPVLKRYQYSATSFAQYQDIQPLSNRELQRYTQIPVSGNARSREFAKQLLAEHSTPAEVIDALMGRFNKQFSYTLAPGVLSSENAIDEFLFDTQLGYCEHFASSTVFILRAAGIPARIATGYQGGRWSENQEYLLVTQADAHAWTEVWYEGKGWVRLDPTSFVAPDRVELGATSFLRQINQSTSLTDRLSYSRLFLEWQTRWDNVNYQWHRWVLNYDTDTQVSFVKKILGGFDPWRIGGFILFPFILLALPWLLKATIAKYKLRRLQKKDVMTIALQQLDKKLAKLGLRREKGESISQFLNRASEQYPEYKEALSSINQQVIQILYEAQQKQSVTEKAFKLAVNSLNIR